MRQMLGSAWTFLKAIRRHLYFIPVYFVLGSWYWTLVILAACSLGRYKWHSWWAAKIFWFVYPPPAEWHDGVFSWWVVGLCLALAGLGYLALTFLPIRRLGPRRALAMVGLLFPAGTALGQLNIVFNRGAQSGVLGANCAALWVVVSVLTVVLAALTVRAWSGTEPGLAGFRMRVLPTLLVLALLVVGVRVGNRGTDFWLWQQGRYAAQWSYFRAARGPLAAELFRYSFKCEDHDYCPRCHRDRYVQLTREHNQRLESLLAARPNDPAADRARLQLAESASDIDEKPDQARKWLDAMQPGGDSEVWADSRLLASRLWQKAEPPNREAALDELQKVDVAAVRGKRVAIWIPKGQVGLLAELNRMDQAGPAAREAVAAADAFGAAEKIDPNDLLEFKADLLMEGGLADEAQKMFLAGYQAKKIEDAEAKAARKVAGLLFARKPEGKPAPPLEGKDLNGKDVQLKDYQGKYLLVDFWATWCGPCMRELPNLLAAYEKLHPKGIEFLGVSLDQKREDLVKVVAEKKIPWPTLFGKEGRSEEHGEAWGISGIPSNFLIGPDGRVLGAEFRGTGIVEKVSGLLGAGQEAKP